MESLQVRVISFSSSPPLLATLQRLFPNSDVGVQSAVDLRGFETKTLVATNIIGHMAAQTLTRGRRWHHEIATKGAVGLAHAVRLALLDDSTRDLLLFEEDCSVKNEQRLLEYVEGLLSKSARFDVAVMGTFHKRQRVDEAVDSLPGWIHLKDEFWGLHCVLYSAHARLRLASALESTLEMQIDSLYGSMAKNDLLKVWGQHGSSCVAQSVHKSDVQDLASLPVSMNIFTLVIWALVLLVVGALFGVAMARWRIGSRT